MKLEDLTFIKRVSYETTEGEKVYEDNLGNKYIEKANHYIVPVEEVDKEVNFEEVEDFLEGE